MADATIRVAITSDNSDLQRGLAESESKLASFGKNVLKVSGAAALAVGAGVVALSKVSVQAASDAQQSLGATETVFGKFADTVVHQSKRAADAFGISANDYRENANVLGALLGNQGVAQDKLARKTHSLIGVSADLAATFGGPTSDAVDALASSFKGEFDPLEKYGISIKQSTVNTEAYRLANVKTKAAFDELKTSQQAQYKQQATTNLLMKQSAKSQGAFARESNTLAHQQQVLGAQWDDLKVKIGNALLPAVTNVFAALTGKLMPALSKLADQYLPDVRRALNDWTKDFDPAAFLSNVADAVRGVDWGSIAGQAAELGGSLRELGSAFKGASIETASDTITVFGAAVKFAADHVDLLVKAMPFLVAAFVGLKSAQLINQSIGRDSILGFVAQVWQTRQLTNATNELAGAMRSANSAQSPFVGSISTATAKLSKFQGGLAAAGGVAGLGLVAASTQVANDKVSTFLSVLGGAGMGAAAGTAILPGWGTAIGAAVGGLGSLVGSLGQSKDAMQEAKPAATDYASALDQITGASTEAARATAYQKLAADGTLGVLQKMGASRRLVVDAVTGEKGARQQLNTILDQQEAAYSNDYFALSHATLARRDAIDALATETDTGKRLKLGERIAGYDEEIDRLTESTHRRREAIDAARRETEEFDKDRKATRQQARAVHEYGEEIKRLPREKRVKIRAEDVATTTKAIAELARRYKLTPKQIKTVIEASGVDTTVKQVKHVRDELIKTGNTKMDGAQYKASVIRTANEAAALARSGGASVGAALKSGTEAGLSGLGTSLANSVTSAVNQAIAAGHHAADSHSPSRKMMRLGQDLGAGLVVGLDSMTADYAKAGARAVTNVGAGARMRRQGAGPGPAYAPSTSARPAVQLAPRQTPIKVYLDGAEIADHLQLRVGRLATTTSVRRKA